MGSPVISSSVPTDLPDGTSYKSESTECGIGLSARLVRNAKSSNSPDDLCVRVLESWSTQLAAEWENIVKESASLKVFATREWLESWWNAYGDDSSLAWFAFYRNQKALGFAPFFRSAAPLFGLKHLTQLRLVGAGSGDSDDLDLIIRPGEEQACLEVLLAELDRLQDWDVCCLENLWVGSIVGQLLPDALQKTGWPYKVTTPAKLCLTLPATWEEYLAALAPDFRPLLTRYPKRLESRYECRLLRCESEEDVERYLPVLFDLHQRRWQEAGQPGAFASVERRQFYRAIASAFLERGWLDFWVLELDGTPAAVQFCCCHGEDVYLLQEGFDPKYAKDRVGYALRAKVLQHYIRTGVKRYDFMGGSDPHKRKFGALRSSYLTIKFARPRSSGALLLALEDLNQRGRTWLRTHLPSALLTWAQKRQERRCLAGTASD